MSNTSVKWDLFVRVFHWTLVLSFAMAWFTGEFSVDDLHSWFGYLITLLIVGRFIWGFVGSMNARFKSFIYSPNETVAYLKSIVQNNPKHYASHNPAGAVMVFALLVVLAVMVGSGFIFEAWGEYEGPLWSMQVAISDACGHLARSLHKFLPEVLLAMVGLHLLGVLVATIQHKENFVMSMINGQENKRN